MIHVEDQEFSFSLKSTGTCNAVSEFGSFHFDSSQLLSMRTNYICFKETLYGMGFVVIFREDEAPAHCHSKGVICEGLRAAVSRLDGQGLER